MAGDHHWSWIRHRLGYPEHRLRELAEGAIDSYSPFDRQARPESKPRHIDNPVGELKKIQKKIKEWLQRECKIHPALHGGVKGRSTRSAAEPHVGASALIGIDISRYFPSVTKSAVYAFFLRRLRCTPDVARCLTMLTTHGGHLPQGASTSTILANLINDRLFEHMAKCAERNGCRFSVYVDDLFVSGVRARECIPDFLSLLGSFNYRPSRKKMRVVPQAEEKVMLGLRVDHGIELPDAKRAVVTERVEKVLLEKKATTAELEGLRRVLANAKVVDPAFANPLGERLVQALASEGITLLPGGFVPSDYPKTWPCDVINCRCPKR